MGRRISTKSGLDTLRGIQVLYPRALAFFIFVVLLAIATVPRARAQDSPRLSVAPRSDGTYSIQLDNYEGQYHISIISGNVTPGSGYTRMVLRGPPGAVFVASAYAKTSNTTTLEKARLTRPICTSRLVLPPASAPPDYQCPPDTREWYFGTITPSDLDIDDDGNIYVAGGDIRQFSPTGALVRTYSTPTDRLPFDQVAVSSAGTVFTITGDAFVSVPALEVYQVSAGGPLQLIFPRAGVLQTKLQARFIDMDETSDIWVEGAEALPSNPDGFAFGPARIYQLSSDGTLKQSFRVPEFPDVPSTSAVSGMSVNADGTLIYVFVETDFVTPPVLPIRKVFILSPPIAGSEDPVATIIGSWGTLGTGAGQFGQFVGNVNATKAGNIVVADPYNDRVQAFSPFGVFLWEWGTEGFGSARVGLFVNPSAADQGPDGSLSIISEGNGTNVYNLLTNRPRAFFAGYDPGTGTDLVILMNTACLEGEQVTLRLSELPGGPPIAQDAIIPSEAEYHLLSNLTPNTSYYLSYRYTHDGSLSEWVTPTYLGPLRPTHPVCLVHGLRSTPEIWDGLRMHLHENGVRYTFAEQQAPYGTPGEISFDKNAESFSGHVEDNLSWLEEQNASICPLPLRPRTLDVVGHSMGGLVSRRYISEYAQSAWSMIAKGRTVRRLTTLGTPHRGAADGECYFILAWSERAPLLDLGPAICELYTWPMARFNQDFPLDIPLFAVGGTGGHLDLCCSTPRLGCLTGLPSVLSALGCPNDGIVPLESSIPHESNITIAASLVTSSCHTEYYNDPEVIAWVTTVLTSQDPEGDLPIDGGSGCPSIQPQIIEERDFYMYDPFLEEEIEIHHKGGDIYIDLLEPGFAGFYARNVPEVGSPRQYSLADYSSIGGGRSDGATTHAEGFSAVLPSVPAGMLTFFIDPNSNTLHTYLGLPDPYYLDGALRVSVNNSKRMEVIASSSVHQPNTPIPLTVVLRDSAESIIGATVLVSALISPSDTLARAQLLDDGLGLDTDPDDGVYVGTISIPSFGAAMTGQQIVGLSVVAEASGFRRLAFPFLQIGTPPVATLSASLQLARTDRGLPRVSWQLEHDFAMASLLRGPSEQMIEIAHGPQLALQGGHEYIDTTALANTAATYWLKLVARDGTVAWVGPETLLPQIGGDLRILGLMPNPILSKAEVRLYVPTAGRVRCSLYDISGRLVLPLSNDVLPSGTVTVPIDLGSQSAGVYFLRVSSSNGRVDTRKLVVVE